MSERVLRLLLGTSVLVTLFLRWNPSSNSTSLSTLLYFFWIASDGLLAILGGTGITNIIGWLGLFLFILSVPLIVLFNLFLPTHSSQRLKKLYRVLMPVLLFLTWYESFRTDPELRGVGFWSNLAAVSAVALIEIVLVFRERLRGQENANQVNDLI